MAFACKTAFRSGNRSIHGLINRLSGAGQHLRPHVQASRGGGGEHLTSKSTPYKEKTAERARTGLKTSYKPGLSLGPKLHLETSVPRRFKRNSSESHPPGEKS